MQDHVHIYVCSTDSLQYFPDNNGSRFRIKLSEPIHFTGSWVAALTSVTVEGEKDTISVLAGQVIEISSNIVGLCIAGGEKRQVLRRLNLCSPIVVKGWKTIYHIDTVENDCFF